MSELLALQKQPSTVLPPSGHTIPNAGVMHAKLVKADFHGSIITGNVVPSPLYQETDCLEVRQSKNPCLVGLSGIVVYESENAFRVITKTDKLKRQSGLCSVSYPAG
jgi:ribonuclease P protein subunit POP4